MPSFLLSYLNGVRRNDDVLDQEDHGAQGLTEEVWHQD